MSEVASAFVTLVPSLRGFTGKLNNQMGPELDKAGKSSGKRFGAVFGGALKVGAVTGGVPSAPLFRVGPEDLG